MTAKVAPQDKPGATEVKDDKIGPPLELPDHATKGEAKKGRGVIKTIWGTTTQLKENDAMDIHIKTTLKELFLYLIFFSALLISTLGMTSFISRSNFLFTKSLETLFESQMKVSDDRSMWDYLEGDFLDGIYNEIWYNDGDTQIADCPDGIPPMGQPCVKKPNERGILMENRIIGRPRMRQLRVHNASCDIPPTFAGIIKRCYARYFEAGEDKEAFTPERRRYSSEDAWRYKTSDELGSSSLSHWGLLASYSPHGFTQILQANKTASQLMMAELKRNLWTGPGTRVVIIDFTVYNVNLNHWCVVRQTFEFPAAGGVTPNSFYTVTKLMRYQEYSDFVVLGAEFTVLLFLVFYTIEEVVEMASLGKQYFMGFFNNTDYTLILLCLVICVHRAITYFIVEPSLKEVPMISDEFVDFTTIGFWSYFLDSLTGALAFLSWVRIFKYVSFNKAMTQLSGTLARSWGDMIGFLIMFFIIFGAFVQLGYLLFGTQIFDYSSLYHTIFALIRTILGDFDFTQLEKANYVFGPIYFLCFVFFVFFVLLNMFLAILSDSFGEVKAELARRKNAFEMGAYFKGGYTNLIDRMGLHTKKMDIEEALKMAEENNYNNKNEVREFLRKRNFGDMEVEIFFERFEFDQKQDMLNLDIDEVKLTLDDDIIVDPEKDPAKTKSESARPRTAAADAESLGRPMSGKEARQRRAERIASAASRILETEEEEVVEEPVEYEEFEQVEDIEHISRSINKKVTVVLHKLESIAEGENKKKVHMSKLMDDFVEGNDMDGMGDDDDDDMDAMDSANEEEEEEDDDGMGAMDSEDDEGMYGMDDEM